jgi:serine/threonine-protein kinase
MAAPGAPEGIAIMKGLAAVGDVLAGKYRVEQILGIGGMGMVVAATHLQLEQRVALKFMLPSAMESPEASARFLREARAAGKLTSEHVCRVTDVGCFDSGAPYIVMEYLEGYDLGTLLKRRGPLRSGPAVDYVLQACEGLAEAHAHGIVHRDLKPDNLYLTARADGGHIIKVLDFGISKADVTGIATRTGDILGSPAYMAPEQMRSTKDVDSRADVWSLGVVLYQLLVGRLPFAGDTLPKLCLSVLNDEPVLANRVRQDLPSGLAEVIARCLAKAPADRYQDVGALADALAPYATPGGAGSVTRVKSALKGRQAPPDPSETIPQGFAVQRAVTAPPAAHRESLPSLAHPETAAITTHRRREELAAQDSHLFAPRAAGRAIAAPIEELAARPVGTTTLGDTASESVEMTTAVPLQPRRVPRWVVAALVAAIAMVSGMIAVVVWDRTDPVGAGGEPRAAARAGEAARAPSPPLVTPIDGTSDGSAHLAGAPDPAGAPPPEPAAGEPAGSASVPDAGVAAAEVPPAPAGTAPRWPPARHRADGPRAPRGGAPLRTVRSGGSGAPRSPAGREDPEPPPKVIEAPASGSADARRDDARGSAARDDEDKWGRMLHDQPGTAP